MVKLCPVCYFSLSFEPANNRICPCCGTEFGFDDLVCSFEDLRTEWIESGRRWWSRSQQAPAGWNPYFQLAGDLLNSSGGRPYPALQARRKLPRRLRDPKKPSRSMANWNEVTNGIRRINSPAVHQNWNG